MELTNDREAFLQARQSLPQDHALMIEVGSAGTNIWPPDEPKPEPIDGYYFTTPGAWEPNPTKLYAALEFLVREERPAACVLGVPLDDEERTALKRRLKKWTSKAQLHDYELLNPSFVHDGKTYWVIDRKRRPVRDNPDVSEL